ncbi:hypothetical protein [Actinomarinicola tropica]|uniref:Uncharacterized protein n=1 Tax=Actinomarinicola tropica TaxID=2789776 RepID=A0A5Q2RPJ8_9ACTN|nr:hypothetical protein [Actinomarinicola tropica]QGG96366.1 hypothetical protein GH723_15370 [Actinomarinicola tropica]
MIDWLLRSRETGEIVVAQPPNVRNLVFVAATLGSWVLPDPRWRDRARSVATVALAAWAADEVVRGVNPFRRLLGAGGLLEVGRRLRH